MPMFAYTCRECGVTHRKLLSRAAAQVQCPICGSAAARDPSPPTSRNVETLDNGAMVRKLERLVDAERLYKERADKDTKERG